MNTVLQVDLVTLSFVAGSVVPLLVAVAAKLNASSSVKSVLNVVLSIVAGLVATMIEAGGSIELHKLLSAGITTYLASGVAYQNLWKPTGVTGSVQERTKGIGIGTVKDDAAYDDVQ